MRSVVNHVVDGIISIDERGIVTTFNPAAERIFGYTADDVIGQNVHVLMPEPYHGEHDGYIANYLRTGEAKIIGIGREVVGRRKDGTTFPMELAISVFRLGDRSNFTGIVRDITERKRAEEELRQAEERMWSVVNHVIDGIITIDEQGKVESFNPAAEKLFGYTRSEVIGQNVKLLMPEPYHGEHDGYISNYVRTGQAKIIGIGREVVGRRKDGSTFPMELAVSAFHIGPRRYFTGIVRDITERKRLEHELRQRVDDLAEADRQKNEFLAMLAHELRNPLAPICNALHLIKMPGADSLTVEEARDMMERQTHQLVR
jgi:PAS domain S-box-containing protein